MTVKNGLPCKKCGTSQWDKWGGCIICTAERKKRWDENNPDKLRERRQRWVQNNKESHTAESTAGKRMRQARWRAKNRGRLSQEKLDWDRRNVDKKRERDRRWKQNNPIKRRAMYHRRRTRETSAGGSYTEGEWVALCAQYENRCIGCGRDGVKLTFDHVIPVSKGGSSDISNGQPLCMKCNLEKGTKVIDYRTKPGIKRWSQNNLFDFGTMKERQK